MCVLLMLFLISSYTSSPYTTMVIKQAQDQLQHSLRCPRCDSANTKFCYYNNYSLSQPRHFCKACKRYWTRGGTLRSVPVGGGSRKNNKFKRAKISGGGGSGGGGVSKRNKVTNQMLYGLEIKNQFGSDLTFPREGASYNGYGIDQCHYYGVDSSSAQNIHDVMNLNASFVSFPGFESCFIDSSLEQQPLVLEDLNESITSSNDQVMFSFQDVAKEVKIEEGSDLMCNKLDFEAPPIEPTSSMDLSMNWSMIWPDLSNYGSSITSLI